MAAETKEIINHSVLNLHIDIDVKLPGTPLAWAVHHNRPHIVKVLLSRGANPERVYPEDSMTPLLWAAHYHYTDCLAAIIRHLESKVTERHIDGTLNLRTALWYGPVVKAAIHAADKFSMILRSGAKYPSCLHSTLDFLREKTQLINFQGGETFGDSQGSLLYYAVTEAHDEVVEYMLDHEWLVETLNEPCGAARRTPVLEAVQWNRPGLYRRLVEHGADVHALVANPFNTDVHNWSALHVFAQEGHDNDLSLVRMLVDDGLPVDSPLTKPEVPNVSDEEEPLLEETMRSVLFSSPDSKNQEITFHEHETPFTVAVRRNAFSLASRLTFLEADPNALRMSSGLFTSPYPLTPLGHTIISNARYSSARLRYLLSQTQPPVNFIVEPKRQLIALHRASMGSQDILKVLGEDRSSRANLTKTQTQRFSRCCLRSGSSRRRSMPGAAAAALEAIPLYTWLLKAVMKRAVEILLDAGADMRVENDLGETPGQLTERLIGLDGSRGGDT